MSALAPPAYLIKACDVLDNPWAVAFNRAQKAGRLLATVLLERAHGARPVILVGFGLGARVIYEACHHLADALDAGDGRAAGCVQHLVVMGLPATCESVMWQRIRTVCAGRVVNAYRPNDLVLSIVHRAANLELGVAGLAEVQSGASRTLTLRRRRRAPPIPPPHGRRAVTHRPRGGVVTKIPIEV